MRLFKILNILGAATLACLLFFVTPSAAGAEVLNLNKASLQEILASRVELSRELAVNLVSYRDKNGPFHAPEALLRVEGMNKSLLTRLGARVDANGDLVVNVPDDDVPEEMRVPEY